MEPVQGEPGVHIHSSLGSILPVVLWYTCLCMKVFIYTQHTYIYKVFVITEVISQVNAERIGFLKTRQ